MHTRPLLPHPSTPAPRVRSLHVCVDRKGDLLQLRYDLKGEIDCLRIPPPRDSLRVDELWRHTCFEAFLKPAGEAGYVELNFSPSTEWAAYRFTGYRAGMAPIAEIATPIIASARTSSQLQLDVSVTLRAISYPVIRLAVSAVVEDDQGRVSYWALAHPPGKPDFHHGDGFVLDD